VFVQERGKMLGIIIGTVAVFLFGVSVGVNLFWMLKG
jgi:hypothetical protein